jgi:hypothetical protein
LIKLKPLPIGPKYANPLKKENPWTKNKLEALTLESEIDDSIDEHEGFILEKPQESC